MKHSKDQKNTCQQRVLPYNQHLFIPHSMQAQDNKHNTLRETTTLKSIKQESNFLYLPNEVIIFILSYLRAYDLCNVQETCHKLNNPTLITSVITYVSNYVYPPSLTDGFDSGVTPKKEGLFITYESMRNMEMLVVARVLSRPEPTSGSGYYISKSWCKHALKWLDAQQEQQEHRKLLQQPHHGKKKKKLSKKQERLRNRKLSNTSPPWPNINHDITCEHGDLQHVTSSKTSRARRKVLDKQTWKVLRKLYPDSIQLSSLSTGCLQCALEAETVRKTQQDMIVQEKQERKKVLDNPHVRKFYTRPGKGFPIHCLKDQWTSNPFKTTSCPLLPGIYYTLPREWCYKWRKYVRSGDGERPHAPDAANLLCDAHRLPLIPPHLEDYLYGYTTSLLGTSTEEQGDIRTLHYHPDTPQSLTEDEAMIVSSGIVSQHELQLQRLQYMNISSPTNITSPRATRQEQLDTNNQVVVEILTEEEYLALEQYWPEISKSFALKFAVVDDDSVVWSTSPCQDCDAGHPDVNYTVPCGVLLIFSAA